MVRVKICNFCFAGGLATQATFGIIGDVVFDAIQQVLYVADSGNARIRAINVSSGLVSTIAHSSSLGNVFGMALDTIQHAIYFADSENNKIQHLNLTSLQISTFAGNGTAAYFGDGTYNIH